MEQVHCPVCAEAIPAASLQEHVETIHPTVVDREVVEAHEQAAHGCPFCPARFGSPEELKAHIAGHGK